MKDKRTLYIIATNFLVQILVAASGFLVPKLILTVYGSTVNGMVNSISQFLSYAALVEMGVGNAAIVALYKPLTEKNIERIESVLYEAKRKYCISGIFYSLIACGITIIYPLTVSRQIDSQLAGTVTLILALNGAIDYFLIGKYKVLLIADQKSYILNLFKCMATVAAMTGSVWLLLNGFSLYYVKLAAVISHLCEAFAIYKYVSKAYPQINFKNAKRTVLDQQSSALLHQICSTVVYNTDLILLTLLLPADSLKEVSVYTVYAMAKGLVTNIVTVFTNGISAVFGELFARQDYAEIKKKFQLYEFIYIIILFSMYSCFMVLILSFVNCYTQNVEDANYKRMSVGILFALVGLTSQLKEASGTMANAAGHYLQTRKFAVAEAVINLGLSIILIRIWNMEGVLFGTVIAHLVMDIGIIHYTAKNLLTGTGKKTAERLLRNLVCVCFLCVFELPRISLADKWADWLLQAIIVASINIAYVILINLLAEPKVLGRLRKPKSI